jgi:hypothetical protein
MTTDLIPLANANAFQLTEKGMKSDWMIRENITERELGIFAGRISDQDMFDVLRFARKYELEAFNAGVAFQRAKENQRMNLERQAMIDRNNELAETVDRLTRGEN